MSLILPIRNIFIHDSHYFIEILPSAQLTPLTGYGCLRNKLLSLAGVYILLFKTQTVCYYIPNIISTCLHLYRCGVKNAVSGTEYLSYYTVLSGQNVSFTVKHLFFRRGLFFAVGRFKRFRGFLCSRLARFFLL